jgi:hypothetical protein
LQPLPYSFFPRKRGKKEYGNGCNVPSRHGSVSNLHTNAPGEAGKISRAAKTLLHETSDANSSFGKTLSSLEFFVILAPKRLAGDPNFEGASAALSRVRAAIRDRDARVDEAFASYINVLSHASIDERLRRDALSRSMQVMISDKKLRQQEVALETGAVDEMEDVLRDLRREKGEWRFVGERIEFTDAGTLRTYRSHLDKLTALWRQMAALEK